MADPGEKYPHYWVKCNDNYDVWTCIYGLMDKLCMELKQNVSLHKVQGKRDQLDNQFDHYKVLCGT